MAVTAGHSGDKTPCLDCRCRHRQTRTLRRSGIAGIRQARIFMRSGLLRTRTTPAPNLSSSRRHPGAGDEQHQGVRTDGNSRADRHRHRRGVAGVTDESSAAERGDDDRRQPETGDTDETRLVDQHRADEGGRRGDDQDHSQQSVDGKPPGPPATARVKPVPMVDPWSEAGRFP